MNLTLTLPMTTPNATAQEFLILISIFIKVLAILSVHLPA